MPLVKDARLLLSLAEVMKISRLTSPLLDAPHQSTPRPRLRHGRRLAFSLTQIKPYKIVYSLLRSITGSPSSSFFSPNFPNCSSPRESASVYVPYLRSHFSTSQPKTLRSRARGYPLSFAEPGALRFCHFALLSSPLNFLRAPPAFPPPLPLAKTKLPIPC